MSFNQPGTIWIRPVIALIVTITLSYTIVNNVNVPAWYIVVATSIVSFYFGHVNGKAEQSTTAAGEIATEAIKRQISRTRMADQPESSPKVSLEESEA